MITLFTLILLTSIWCIGIKIATANGMILEKLGHYAESKALEGRKIYEPLIVCPWCLPSIHSIFGYAFALGMGSITHFSWSLVVIYPLVVAGASIVTGFTWSIYLTINSIKEAYDATTQEFDEASAKQEQEPHFYAN